MKQHNCNRQILKKAVRIIKDILYRKILKWFVYITVKDIVINNLVQGAGIGCSPNVLPEKGRIIGYRSARSILNKEYVIIQVQVNNDNNYYIVRSGVIVYHGRGTIQSGVLDLLHTGVFIQAIEMAALGRWLECKKFCEDNYLMIIREIIFDNHLENTLGEWID